MHGTVVVMSPKQTFLFNKFCPCWVNSCPTNDALFPCVLGARHKLSSLSLHHIFFSPGLHFHLLVLTFSTLQCDAIFAPPTDSCCCRHWQRKPWQLAFQWNDPKPLKPSNLLQGYFRHIRIYAVPSPLSTYHLLGHDTKLLRQTTCQGF